MIAGLINAFVWGGIFGAAGLFLLYYGWNSTVKRPLPRTPAGLPSKARWSACR